MTRPQSDALLDRLLRLSTKDRDIVLRQLSPVQRRGLDELWSMWALAGQLEPPGDWRIWVMQAGRGFGKTRAGAEWVSEIARQFPGARIALVAATIDEARRVMVEGDSGVLSVVRAHEEITWLRDRNEIVFASTARAYLYSAGAPESLRGPQHDAAWCDELAKWRYGDTAWSNLLLGLRLGVRPRVVVTTTPKPAPGPSGWIRAALRRTWRGCGRAWKARWARARIGRGGRWKRRCCARSGRASWGSTT